MGNRQKDFRLGVLHGKIKPEKDVCEAKLRNKIFLHKRIVIKRSCNPNQNLHVRLFAYEMPLEDTTRGNCVDLVGYDKDHNLYLIELKQDKSTQKLSKAIEEINGYEKIVKDIKGKIKQDFEKTFYFPIQFKAIRKIILAPRGYYRKKTPEGKNKDTTIEYLYFGDESVINRGLEQEEDWGPIFVHVEK